MSLLGFPSKLLNVCNRIHSVSICSFMHEIYLDHDSVNMINNQQLSLNVYDFETMELIIGFDA